MVTDGDRPVVPGFLIRGRIGSGATATVWWAQDRDTGEEFAVKVASGGGEARKPDDAAAEAREIAVLRRLDHPHIVRLHRVVDLHDGRRALVLELAALSLTELLAQHRRFSPGEVVSVLAPIAGALAHLHSRGIVHGDVSPGNILLTEAGTPLLADLGVARVLGAAGDDPVRSFETPGFGAPELRAGAPPTAAADVWGLGMVVRSLHRPVAEGSAGRGDGLAGLVTSCTATDPEDRPTAAMVERALRLAARGVALDPPPVPPIERAVTRRTGAPAAQPIRVPGATDAVRGTSERGRRRAVVGLVGGALSALLLLSGVMIWETVRDSAAASAQVALNTARGDQAAVGKGGSVDRPAGGLVSSPMAEDPVAAVQRIARDRAATLASGSTAGLGSVDVVGSPAWRTDAATIAALRRAGVRLVGLRFAVISARLVRWEDDAAVVRASVTVSAHRRNGPEGSVDVPEQRAAPVDLVLVEIDSGAWRVRSIGPAQGAAGAGSGPGT